MKKKLLLILALAVVSIGYSQNEYLDYKYSFSSNLHIRKQYSNFGAWTPEQYVSGLTASFSIMNERKNLHELSLERIGFASNPYYLNNGIIVAKTFNLEVGYKYHINLIKNKNARWIPSIGFGAHLVYENRTGTSSTPNYFPSKSNLFGIDYYVQPALTFHANKRLYFNLSIPLNVITTSAYQYKTFNPSIEPNNVRINNFNLDTGLNIFQAKFGVGIKF